MLTIEMSTWFFEVKENREIVTNNDLSIKYFVKNDYENATKRRS